MVYFLRIPSYSRRIVEDAPMKRGLCWLAEQIYGDNAEGIAVEMDRRHSAPREAVPIHWSG